MLIYMLHPLLQLWPLVKYTALAPPIVSLGNAFFPKIFKYGVIWNISPSADRSCSSGLNGSDPEQMSHN